MKAYDFLVVGAGLFGSVFAHEAARRGKRCLVLEKRGQIGGNCACAEMDGLTVHLYGAHLFHTDDADVWAYVQNAAAFRPYQHTVMANYQGELFNLPFNMNTFYALWGVRTAEEAAAQLASFAQTVPAVAGGAENLEDRAIAKVGAKAYEKLIKHYTEKQWGRPARELPAFIIERLPLRLTFDNRYFDDRYQALPEESYNKLFEYWLAKADVRLNCDFLADRKFWAGQAETLLYTGALDAFYDYRFGELGYRSLRFEHEWLEKENVQACAVMNYTDAQTPYTRILEHRHFGGASAGQAAPGRSLITREYPQPWTRAVEAYYPINDAQNNALYQRYRLLADAEERALFGGRLADYCYYDMDDCIAAALRLAERALAN